MTRKSPTVVIILMLSLFLPLMGTFSPGKAQTNAHRFSVKKMTEDLLARTRHSRVGSGEKTRVIFNVSAATSSDRARSVLQSAGANVSKQLDALNVIVAEVPVEALESLAARDEVSWISADQEVRSLDSLDTTTTDNTSHVELTTGASKVLPLDTNHQIGSGVATGVPATALA